MNGHCLHCVDSCQAHKHPECKSPCCRTHWSTRAKWDDGHCPACAERESVAAWLDELCFHAQAVLIRESYPSPPKNPCGAIGVNAQ